MTDLSQTIAPKSDQINADDLIGGPKTIKVTRVSGNDAAEQPINIYFEGDDGKPFRPCKSMRRVLVECWGPDGNTYGGRSMTLYRDPEVKFGGAAVGGIRISHLTNIDRPKTMALTESKARRRPYTVQPLVVGPSGSGISDADLAKLKATAEAAASKGMQEFTSFWNSADVKPVRHYLNDIMGRLKKLIEEVEAQRSAAETQDDPFAGGGDPDPQLTDDEAERLACEAREESDRMAQEAAE